MALAPFAVSADLALRLGKTFTDAEEAQADALLDDASNVIRNYIGQAINYVADDVVELRATDGVYLYLPESPVASVTSVVLDGVTLVQGTDYYLVKNRLYRAAGWSASPDNEDVVTVTYTHGNEEVPGVIKAIALQVAGRVFANPDNIKSESVGQSRVDYAVTDAGIALTEAEMRTLDKFKPTKRQLSSVRLRSMWS